MIRSFKMILEPLSCKRINFIRVDCSHEWKPIRYVIYIYIFFFLEDRRHKYNTKKKRKTTRKQIAFWHIRFMWSLYTIYRYGLLYFSLYAKCGLLIMRLLYEGYFGVRWFLGKKRKRGKNKKPHKVKLSTAQKIRKKI